MTPPLSGGHFYKIPLIGDCILVVPTEYSPNREQLANELEDFALFQFASAEKAAKDVEKPMTMQELINFWLAKLDSEKEK